MREIRGMGELNSMSRARCVALTQEHRGHGVSSAAYYLSRSLVAQGLRVLLVDVTGRRGRLQTLAQRGPVKNLVLWSPPLARPEDVAPALEHARHETAGRADVLLLDIDAAILVRAGGFDAGVDYVVAVTEQTPAGLATADRIAEHLHDVLPPDGRVGVVLSRVDAPNAANLPDQTEQRHLPVLGYYPADYLLAGGDAYSLKGGEPSSPHDTYLFALTRLGQKLTHLVPLRRHNTLVEVSAQIAPSESAGHTAL